MRKWTPDNEKALLEAIEKHAPRDEHYKNQGYRAKDGFWDGIAGSLFENHGMLVTGKACRRHHEIVESRDDTVHEPVTQGSPLAPVLDAIDLIGHSIAHLSDYTGIELRNIGERITAIEEFLTSSAPRKNNRPPGVICPCDPKNPPIRGSLVSTLGGEVLGMVVRTSPSNGWTDVHLERTKVSHRFQTNELAFFRRGAA